MKRKDLIILLAVLALALAAFLTREMWSGALGMGEDVPRLRISIGGVVDREIPLNKTDTIELLQEDGKRNVVSMFPGGFVMQESNCHNQDCIHQGEVTVDNVDTRLLYHQIICLPNQVVLEMVDGEETQLLEVLP